MVLPLMIGLVVCILLLTGFLIYSYYRAAQLKKRLAVMQIQLLNEVKQQQSLENNFKIIKEKFEHANLYDPLTGLAGLQVFEDRLQQILKQSERYQLVFSVMILDLDGFKLINNALGSDASNCLLKEVAIRLQSLVRQSDSVSHLSSDEFGLLLSHLLKPEMAAYVAQRILEAIAQPFKIEGQEQELYITASIGISTYPLDGEDIKTLLKKANNAMHQAKARGRNTFQFYRAEMHALSQRDLRLSSSLQKSEVFNEFGILYQPIINIEMGAIMGMQASLNWQHVDYGLLESQDFLWLAENNNRIIEIGEWLLNQVLNQFIMWKKQNLPINTITVGISLRQAENPRFAYKLAQTLQEMNVDPTCLVLEISETALPLKLDFIEKVLNMLKHIGVQIAIKNFGTGQLSLQYLQRFPIDYLKISSAIVQEVTTNKDNESMVNMIIMLAKSLQIFVVAEGVESKKQRHLLMHLGCYNMQGNLFAAPLQAKDITHEKINELINSASIPTQTKTPSDPTRE